MKKRFLSVILALCLCMSLLPVTAGAVEDSHTDHPVCGATCTHDTAPDADDIQAEHTSLTEWKKLSWDSENSKLCVDGSALSTTYVDAEQCYSLASGSYYLADSLTLDESIYVPAGNTVTLCLNGKALTSTVSGSDGAIKVDGTLNLCDCIGGGTLKSSAYGVYVNVAETTAGSFAMYGGTISNGSGSYQSGVFLRRNASNATTYPGFTMYGGTISGFKGSGVEVSDYGIFTMHGGTINGNTKSGYGGGVYVGSNAVFTMKNGTISNNSSSNSGGGVYARGTFTMGNGEIKNNTSSNNYGGGVYVTSDQTFTMKDGSITNNTANSGGGVYISSGTFVMEKGSITGNTAIYNGGGVYNGGTMTISGTVVIKDNIKSNSGNESSNNVYLVWGNIITVAGALTTEESIGVTTYPAPSEGSPKDITGSNSADYSAYFFADDSTNYHVENTGSGDTQVVKLCAGASGGSTPTAEMPNITGNLSATEVNYVKEADATALSITVAEPTDSGTLSYQWYSNTTNSTDGTLISGATSATYTPATSATGTTYYYCVVTNTKSGATATATSNIAKITVTEASVPTTYTVTYDAYGADSGTAPTDGNSPYNSDATVTVLGNTGNLEKSGYTFVGWNTASDGSGTDYAAGATFTISENTVLYAKWTQNEGEKEAAVDNTAAGSYAGTTVSDWGDLATKDEHGIDYASNVVVEVKLTVTAKTEQTVSSEEVTAIKEVASGKTVNFIDLTLSKTVDSTPIDNFGSSNTTVLAITIPFDTSGKENITVYRYHGTSAAAMSKDTPVDGEYFTVGNGSITIYAKKFSTYAIGYTLAVSEPVYYEPTYRVAVAKSENGAVKSSRTYAYAYDTVTLTVTPEEGCELDSLTVTDNRGNEIALTDKGEGKYTFRMPYRNVTVTAVFHRCPSAGLTDVDRSQWYHEAIDYVLVNDLMDTADETNFDRTSPATRAVLVEAIWRNEGCPVVDYLMTYPDVDRNAGYAEAIRWASSVGIVNGFPDGTFHPDEAITREQLATLFYRYEQYKGEGFEGDWTYELPYADAGEVGDWAYEAVCWNTMNSIVQGDGTNFDPKGTATRDHVAQLLMNYLERAEDRRIGELGPE